MRSLSAVLAAWCVATVGHAQRTITPGDAALRPQHVRLATDTIVMLTTRPHGPEQLAMTVVRRIERARDEVGDIFRQIQVSESPDGASELDTLDVSAQTLSMHRLVEVQDADRMVLRFDGARLSGTITADDSTTQLVDMRSGPFFHAMMTEGFIGVYPLDPGTTVEFPELWQANVAARPATLVADRSVAIETADGRVDCLLVHGPRNVTMWVARDDGHLVRLRWTARDGMVVWKLPRRDVSFRRPSDG